jgi:Asp-tRNA(Asn)/Glu-tRNA(Gln) amidotransferase A subunit family amidase
MMQAIAGYDSRDPTSVDKPVPNFVAALREKPKPLKIGVPRAYFYDGLDPEVAAAIEQALSMLQTIGGHLQEVEPAVPADRTLQSAESYAVHGDFVARSPELYQPETLRRIRSGEKISAAEIAERRCELAQIRRDVAGSVFRNVDVLVTPTMPVPAPNLDELKNNPDLLRPRELLLLRNTRPANVWGVPAISVPCGFTSAGLPIGLQIIGRPWEETTVLQLAYAYEQSYRVAQARTGNCRQRPKIRARIQVAVQLLFSSRDDPREIPRPAGESAGLRDDCPSQGGAIPGRPGHQPTYCVPELSMNLTTSFFIFFRSSACRYIMCPAS